MLNRFHGNKGNLQITIEQGLCMSKMLVWRPT